MIIVYDIDCNSQVLKNGTWGSPDCDWDWETKTFRYYTRKRADIAFGSFKPDNDTPIITMYEVAMNRRGEELGRDAVKRKIATANGVEILMPNEF